MTRGRPSNYDAAKAAALCFFIREGGTLARACVAVNVSRATVYSWRQSHAEFARAIERARIEATNKCADVAAGISYKDTLKAEALNWYAQAGA
jgi:transposase-like protein